MADTRIKDLPVASTLADNDSLVIDATAAGNRQITGAVLKTFLGAQRPFTVTSAGLVVSVTAGSRILRTGASAAYGGGTVSVPDNATSWIVHTAANALSALATLPTANEDVLIIARVVAAGGAITSLVRDDPMGGMMRGERNLGELADAATARANLGTLVGAPATIFVTGAGSVNVAMPAGTQHFTQYIDVSTSTASYTFYVLPQRSPAPQIGAKMTLLLNSAAGSSGRFFSTVEVRLDSTLGVLFHTTTMGPVDRRDAVRLTWNGTTWVLDGAGPIPAAGAVALQEVASTRNASGAIKFDGTVGKYAEGSIRGVTIGTGDYSVVLLINLTSPGLASGGFFALDGVAGGGSVAGAAGGIYALIGSGGYNFTYAVRNASGIAANSGTFNLAAYAGRTVQLALTRRDGVIGCYVDGAPFTITPSANDAGAMVGDPLYFRLGNVSGSGASYPGQFYQFQVFNRALSAPDLRLLAARGVPTEDRNATGLVVGGSLGNGNLDTWSAAGTAGVANGTATGWSFGTAVGGSITQNTVGALGGGNDLLFTRASAPAVFSSTTPAAMVNGSRYRLSFLAKLVTGASNVLALSPSGVAILSTPLTSTATSYTVEYVADAAVAASMQINGNASSAQFDNITYERIGCLVDIDCGAGSGFALPDLQGRFPLVLIPAAYGNFFHMRPARRGQFLAFVTAAGNTQIAGLPANARINSIIADAASAVTASIGNASAGSQIVASAALITGKQDLTLAARYTTTQNLWVNLSAAVSVTLTVNFELVS